jgi:hypothetical protein
MSELSPELNKDIRDAVESAARKINDEVMELRLAPQDTESENVALHDWYEGGIPPIGLTFEFTSNGGHNWSARTIIYKDDSAILLDGYQLFKLADPDIGFRPIRTPDQIPSEERNKAIEAMAAITGGSDLRACIELYDAGYRKP